MFSSYASILLTQHPYMLTLHPCLATSINQHFPFQRLLSFVTLRLPDRLLPQLFSGSFSHYYSRGSIDQMLFHHLLVIPGSFFPCPSISFTLGKWRPPDHVMLHYLPCGHLLSSLQDEILGKIYFLLATCKKLDLQNINWRTTITGFALKMAEKWDSFTTAAAFPHQQLDCALKQDLVGHLGNFPRTTRVSEGKN